MDKNFIRKNFKRSIATYNTNAFMQKEICNKIIEITDAYAKCRYNKVFEIGCGTGLLSERLIKMFEIEKYGLNDLVDEMYDEIKLIMRVNGFNDFTFLSGDAEYVEFPKENDLIISSSTLQWFTELNVFFKKIRASLSNEGFFIFNTYGSDNFKEIKNVCGGGLEYKSYENVLEKLARHFEIKYSENSIKSLSFKTPKDILKHLSLTGVNGTKVSKAWTKQTLNKFERRYIEQYSEGNGVYITYNPMYFVCTHKK